MRSFKILLLALVVTAVAGTAQAQNLLVNPQDNTAYGLKMPVYNSTDSLILDGDLVMADSTASTAYINSDRPVVRKYLGLSLDRPRVLGIAVGNINKSSQGGTGTILIWGYHPKAFVGVSTAAAKAVLKVGLAGGFQVADTLECGCGYVIGMSSATPATGPRYRYKIWFTGTKPCGATL